MSAGREEIRDGAGTASVGGEDAAAAPRDSRQALAMRRIAEARAYNEAHPDQVADFDRLTGGVASKGIRAIMAWQRDHGLRADGRIGAAALSAAATAAQAGESGGGNAANEKAAGRESNAKDDKAADESRAPSPGATASAAPHEDGEHAGDSAADEASASDAPAAQAETVAAKRNDGASAPGRAAIPASDGSPLPTNVRARMEGPLGVDLSGVKVHTGADSMKAANDLSARAFTVGQNVHFGASEFAPGTKEGDHLLAHELTHVAQAQKSGVARKADAGEAPNEGVKASQPHEPAEKEADAVADGVAARLHGGSAAHAKAIAQPAAPVSRKTIYRFGSTEHQSLGNHATGSASYDVGAGGNDLFQLQHGDIVALSGDYFLAGSMTSEKAGAAGHGNADDLFQLAERPGNRGQAVGTRDEIIWTLKSINGSDPRFQPGGVWADYVFSDGVKAAVNERYQRLAASNNSHFPSPEGRDASGQPNPAPAGSAGSSYRSLHEGALRMAAQAASRHESIDRAMAMEAAGQHYLTDSFSAGHARTPIMAIREYWGQRYPLFWYNLRHKMALDTAVKLNDQDTNLTTVVGTVNQMYQALSEKIEGMASSLPAVTLGDLLGKVFHDRDNAQGLAIQGGGKIYGDGHLDDANPENKTRALAERAIQDGNADVQRAFQLGQSAGALADDQLFSQVRAATGTNEQYLAETRMPVPSASEPQQNWKAGSIEELWSRPVVGSTGPTVGAKITEALSSGGEIRETLDALGDKFPETDERWSGNLHPRSAYRDGFVNPLVGNPLQGIVSIVNWAPSYGLASNSRDDVSLQTGQQLDRGGQLGGMTAPARVSYVRELLGGYTSDEEGELVVRVFQTAPVADRRMIYEQIEGHSWNGKFHESTLHIGGDKLYRSLNDDQIDRLRNIING